MLAWNAWNIGASGIGFWSYSDTQGSSAWDDFDGVRPDWAVVYEGDGKPITSRRWEAFREGVEDYKLLKAGYADENSTCFSSLIDYKLRERLRENTIDSMLLDSYRKQLLGCLSRH